MAEAVERVARRRPFGRPPARKGERAVYPGRFMLAYVVLVLLFGAALASVAFFGDRPERADTAAGWSAFRPQGNETQKTRAIVRHVTTRYRVRGGRPLTQILGGEPEAASSGGETVPISEFVVRSGADRRTLDADKAAMFILCGSGEECAPPPGASGDGYERLVRRQALELALYSFQYVGVDSVVALLPPNTDAGAVLLERRHVEPLLERPLGQTLPGRRDPSPDDISTLEAATIDYLTLSNRFLYAFQPAGDGTARMVLNPSSPVD